MNIQKIPVDLIDAGNRLRTLNPIYVAEIKASFQEKGGEGKGQIQAIEVREKGEDGKHRLVVGLHRLQAARELGWKTIAATVFRGTNDEARMREIDENLVRHDLSALDRARFLAQREQVWVLLNPDSVQGRAGAMARWHADRNFCFASNAAEKLGVSDDTIRRALTLDRAMRRLGEEERERIASTDLANNHSELLALAKIEDADTRGRVLDLLLSPDAEQRAKKVAGAIAKLKDMPPEHLTPVQAAFDAFVRKWATYSPEVREKIAEYVIADMKKKSRRSAKQ